MELNISVCLIEDFEYLIENHYLFHILKEISSSQLLGKYGQIIKSLRIHEQHNLFSYISETMPPSE